jgi:hypothetical protein
MDHLQHSFYTTETGFRNMQLHYLAGQQVAQVAVLGVSGNASDHVAGIDVAAGVE